MKSTKMTVGTPADTINNRGWVQTGRNVHEAWAHFCIKHSTAAGLMHHLVANMGHLNAVVISQKVSAKVLGVSDRTIRSAVATLVKHKWIQVVRLGKGKEVAYVVNDRVAWGQARNELRLSVFSATIVADFDDQDASTLENVDLRRIPTLYDGEMQLPSGDGDAPPSQQLLEGIEPDLPALKG